MRVNPRGNNPKARIFNRYTSLVRYICDWRNLTNPSQKYKAIIIIAHSQGTVITADLLRILQYSNTSLAHINSGLQPPSASPRSLPIYLYTMGSPLQQLYGVAFPSLYHWVKDFNQVRQFGLTHWKNVYCSGDYVGRSLWAHREIAGFDEVCVGAGAHTHYWDGTIPAVAQYLDELIQAATQTSSSLASQDELNVEA